MLGREFCAQCSQGQLLLSGISAKPHLDGSWEYPQSQRFGFHSRGSWAGWAAPGLEFALTGLQPALPRPLLTQSELGCLAIYKTQVEEGAERVEIRLSLRLR